MSALAITRPQRDALWDEIFAGLSGIGDIWLAAEAGNFSAADRLARQFSDDLVFVLNDLGWGESVDLPEEIELSTPPEVLKRVLERLRDRGRARDERESAERQIAEESPANPRRLYATCEELLGRIEVAHPSVSG